MLAIFDSLDYYLLIVTRVAVEIRTVKEIAIMAELDTIFAVLPEICPANRSINSQEY